MYDWLVKSVIVDQINYYSFIIFISIFVLIFISNVIFLLMNNKKILKINKLNFVGFLLFYIGVNIVTINQDDYLTNIIRILALLSVYFALNCIISKTNSYIQKYNMIFSILFSIIIYNILTLIIYLIDPSSVSGGEIVGNRMFGFTDHPNFFGLISAIGLSISIYLITKSLKKALLFQNNWTRLTIILSIPMNAWTLFMSGSRTALLFFIIATLINSIKLNYKVFLSTIILLSSAAFIYIQFFTEPDMLPRIFSLTNNRTFAWNEMLNIFYENPLFGVGFQSVGYSENSYLWLLSGSGLIGFILFTIFLSIFFIHIKKYRFGFEFFAPIFICALFEGYLIDSFTLPTLLILFLYSVNNHNLLNNTHTFEKIS